MPKSPPAASLAQVRGPAGARATLLMLGPAFVAAIAYVDPGNVAANLTAGARYGYLLLWVLVVGFGVEYRDAGTQRIVVGGMVGFGAESLQLGRHVPGDGGPDPGGVASILTAGTHSPALEGKGRA